MRNTKLSEHVLKKGKFQTPLNELFLKYNAKDTEHTWFHSRRCEYIWLGLIIQYYGRENGITKSIEILKCLNEISKEISIPMFSKIIMLDNVTQDKFYKKILEYIDIKVLSPLTLIFTFSNYQVFAEYFYTPNMSIEERENKINSFLQETSMHQSNFSTDIRFLVLYFSIFSGYSKMPEDLLQEMIEYPMLSHDDEKMCSIRPMIRSTEGLYLDMIDVDNKDYINIFWEAVSKMSKCELVVIKIDDNEPDTEDYLKKLKNIFQYYSDLYTSTSPLDNKMLVLLSIATYSYKRFIEVVEHKLYNTISGRGVVRVMIECYIMMKYLIQNESNHKDIWQEYQYYGLGQYKLIVERYKESNKCILDSHIMYDYIDILVGEYKDKEFIDMDTKYFNKESTRERAKNLGEKDLYDFYYDYDSAFEHGLWGAIRESSLLRCDNSSHQYHCVPDIGNNIKLKSVYNDCAYIMDKTINLLKDIYGLANQLEEGSNNE